MEETKFAGPRPGSVEDLLVGQISALIYETARHAALLCEPSKEGDELEMEIHFHKLVGLNCTAKAEMLKTLLPDPVTQEAKP